MEQDEQWKQRILDYQESGLTMKAWCAARDIPFHQLKYWTRKLSMGRRKRQSTSWVTVTPILDPSPQEHTLVVRMGAASIDIHPGFDPSLLSQVVRALEANR